MNAVLRSFARENYEILNFELPGQVYTQTVQKCLLSGGRTQYKRYLVIASHKNPTFMSDNTVKQQILFYILTRHPGPGYNMFSKSNESEIVENKNTI